jgi:hypothetical protein
MQIKKIRHAKCRDDVQLVIQDFIEHTIAAAYAEQYNHIYIAATFPMRLVAGRTDGVAAGWPNFLQVTVGVIQAVFALNHKGIIQDLMPVQDDLLARRKFKQDIDDFGRFINSQYRILQVLKAVEYLPVNQTVVKAVVCHEKSPVLRCGVVPRLANETSGNSIIGVLLCHQPKFAR